MVILFLKNRVLDTNPPCVRSERRQGGFLTTELYKSFSQEFCPSLIIRRAVPPTIYIPIFPLPAAGMGFVHFRYQKFLRFLPCSGMLRIQFSTTISAVYMFKFSLKSPNLVHSLSRLHHAFFLDARKFNFEIFLLFCRIASTTEVPNHDLLNHD